MRPLAIALLAAGCIPGAAQQFSPENLAPYIPTPQAIVDAMLDYAQVKPVDVVYDLGSGDGRIVIAAAKQFGARGVGVELDPALCRTAERRVKELGLGDRRLRGLLAKAAARAPGSRSRPPRRRQRPPSPPADSAYPSYRRRRVRRRSRQRWGGSR